MLAGAEIGDDDRKHVDCSDLFLFVCTGLRLCAREHDSKGGMGSYLSVLMSTISTAVFHHTGALIRWLMGSSR